jgi:hypothetical protein
MPRENVCDFVSRDILEARKAGEDHLVYVQKIAATKTELHLTIMQSRIRLAEVMATLRQFARFVDSRGS